MSRRAQGGFDQWKASAARSSRLAVDDDDGHAASSLAQPRNRRMSLVVVFFVQILLVVFCLSIGGGECAYEWWHAGRDLSLGDNRRSRSVDRKKPGDQLRDRSQSPDKQGDRSPSPDQQRDGSHRSRERSRSSSRRKRRSRSQPHLLDHIPYSEQPIEDGSKEHPYRVFRYSKHYGETHMLPVERELRFVGDEDKIKTQKKWFLYRPYDY